MVRARLEWLHPLSTGALAPVSQRRYAHPPRDGAKGAHQASMRLTLLIQPEVLINCRLPIGQLAEAWGQHGASAIIGSCGSLVAFAPAPGDDETAAFLSKAAGMVGRLPARVSMRLPESPWIAPGTGTSPTRPTIASVRSHPRGL